MNEIQTTDALPNPFDKVGTGKPGEVIEFVMHECKTCGERGPVVQVVKDDQGRVISSSTFDSEHYAETGGKKGLSYDRPGHSKFFFYTITRTNGEVFIF